jgi:nucleoside-diphosphate-sugar epimerase
VRILITGGAGYIGSVLTPSLLSEGHHITVLDNFMFGQQSLLDCCYHPNLSILRGDVRNESLIAKLMNDADVIIPLACLVGAPICDKFPMDARAINFDAIRLINKLRSSDQIIIFPTTNSGYGIGEKGVFCTEKSALNPISLYGRLKVQIEDELLSTGNAITLRLATVFGISPRMRLDLLVNDFTYRAVNDGYIVVYQANYMRNYIHIRDVARSFVHCIRNFEGMRDNPYNVGLSDANLSKWQLCQEIKKQLPDFYFVEAEVGEDKDKRDYIVSNEKFEATGFLPQVSLQEGISELIKGYQVIKRNTYSNV